MLFICKINYIDIFSKIKSLKKIKKKGLINPFGEHEVFLFWIQV